MLKKGIGLVAVLLAIVVGVGVYLYQKPVSSIKKKDANHVLKAISLLNEFSTNESEANANYLDKILEVSGEIYAVEDQKILLKTNQPFHVVCEMAEGFDAGQHKPGDQITCKGVCAGKLMDVILTRCVIVN